jgi:hypothetical protein
VAVVLAVNLFLQFVFETYASNRNYKTSKTRAVFVKSIQFNFIRQSDFYKKTKHICIVTNTILCWFSGLPRFDQFCVSASISLVPVVVWLYFTLAHTTLAFSLILIHQRSSSVLYHLG